VTAEQTPYQERKSFLCLPMQNWSTETATLLLNTKLLPSMASIQALKMKKRRLSIIASQRSASLKKSPETTQV